MKKIWKEKDDLGQDVIYVEKCDKYEYENPEKPKNDLHNEMFVKIDDIIDAVENYFYNSGK